MVAIPAGKFRFKVSGVEIEGGDAPGVDVQYPWEDLPRRHHDHEMEMKSFYIDNYPVTHAQFKKFLDATQLPAQGRSQLPQRLGQCRHSSGRLGEQTRDLGLPGRCPRLCGLGRQTPASRVGMAIRCPRIRWPPVSLGPRTNANVMPKPEDGPQPRPASDVDAFPEGASPFGVHGSDG